MNSEYAISIDPASRNAGVSLWVGRCYIASKALFSDQKTWSARAAELRADLKFFVQEHLIKDMKITCIVSELIPKIVEPSVQMITGAIVSDPIFDANITRKHLISPSAWKSYAKRHGCDHKEPKGVKSLIQVRPDLDFIISDDVADSILIYLTYCEKNDIR